MGLACSPGLRYDIVPSAARAPASSRGDRNASVHKTSPPGFVCLLFDDTEAVVGTEVIDAADEGVADLRALAVALVRPDVAGYELWRGGERLKRIVAKRDHSRLKS